MKETHRLNDTANYSNVYADFGIHSDRLPEKAAFAVEGFEIAGRTPVPYEPTAMVRFLAMMDDVDVAIIEEVARSKYLVSFQIFQYLGLRGFSVKRTGLRNRLNKLLKYRILREFEIRREGLESGLRYYELDYRGFQIAQERGVVFHMGNRFLSDRKKEEQGFVEDVVAVKRILAANMVILGLLRNGVCLDGFGFNETVRVTNCDSIVDDCILRTQGIFWIGEDSVFLVEVVRSTERGLEKLADKVKRYYALVNNANYLVENAHGHTALPQLVVCAESLEHAQEIDRFLRSEGLWKEEDTILYTHDLLHMKTSLRTLYEMNEDGSLVWYSLPSRYVQPLTVCA